MKTFKKRGFSDIRRLALAVMATAAVSVTGLAVSTPAHAQTTLRAAFYQPEGHPIIELSKEAFAKIEEQTEGRVKFRAYGASTLMPTTEMAAGVNDGTAFMAIWYMPYMSKTIPLFDIETIPVWTAGCDAIVETFNNGLNDLYTEALSRQGLPNVKVAGVSECLPRVLATRDLIRSPEEVKGVKIRSVGAESEMFRAIGASPTNMTMDQAYEAMSRGIIDGITNAVMMIEDRSQFELVKNVTNMNLTYVLMHVIYNPALLDKVDPQDRDIVVRGMRDVADHVRVGLTKLNEESVVRVSDKYGVTFYDPNESEQNDWFAAARESREKFEELASDDPLIAKGLELVYKYNPQK